MIYMIYMTYKICRPTFNKKATPGSCFFVDGKISFSGDGLSAARAKQPAACAVPLRGGP